MWGGRQRALGAASPRQRRLPVLEQWLVPGRETHGRRAGDRDMDRGEAEKWRERGRSEDASLRNKEKRASSGRKLKISLPQRMGEGVGVACLLKRQKTITAAIV